MADPLVIVHHHPGRIRVRAERLRDPGAGDLFLALRAALQREPAVRGLTHNPFTGSVVIEYEPGHAEPDVLLANAAAAAGLDGVVEESALRSQGEDPAKVVVRTARKLDEIVREATGGRAGLRALLPGALAAGAGLSFLRRPELPRWESLLYWSYTFFVDLNARAIAQAADEAENGDDG